MNKKLVKVYNADNLTGAPTEILDSLLLDSWDTIKLFTHLDDDVSKLLRKLQLNTKQLQDLLEVKRCVVEKIYTLFYLPGKWFSIDKGFGQGKKWTGFSDLSQYGTDNGQEVYDAYLELGFNPGNLISPSNVYRKEVLEKVDLPKVGDIPIEAAEIAYECCVGNWVEAYAIGHFDKVFDYDLRSAYPSEAMKLIDLRLGAWHQSKEYMKEAVYGYCRCAVTIEENFSPIVKSYNDRNYTPSGSFETSLTKAEIDFILQWQIGSVTILDGWWWTCPLTLKNAPNRRVNGQSSVIPLSDEVTRLYGLKSTTSGVKKDIIKRIMAGSYYGVFIEMRGDEFGDMFLPPYAAEIEANTRLKLAGLCYEANVTPLHVTVDGLITEKEIPYCRSDDIGSMRLERIGRSLICSSGLACIEGKHGAGDFSIEYSWLMNQIAGKPDEDKYILQTEQVLSLAQAAHLNRIQDVGTVEMITRSVEFADNKRSYEVIPDTFGQLAKGKYYSEPWDASTLSILESPDENM